MKKQQRQPASQGSGHRNSPESAQDESLKPSTVDTILLNRFPPSFLRADVDPKSPKAVSMEPWDRSFTECVSVAGRWLLARSGEIARSKLGKVQLPPPILAAVQPVCMRDD
jgi:hypothetical protein